MKRLIQTSALSLFSWIVAVPAFAQTISDGLNVTAGQAGILSTRTPSSIVGGLINALLGVLGIVLVILIIYGGILYMTAGGDDAKVGKAKQILTNAIIGLIIIVAAYGISLFVIGRLATSFSANPSS